jgi:hypothetical protein
MAYSISKVAKRNNDEYYTPNILVEPIIKHLQIWSDNFLKNNKRQPIILCPFDTINSEFVITLKNKYNVKYGHIDTGQDFFTFDYGQYDIVISNPPFSKKKIIYEKLFELNKPFALIANLMQLNCEGIGRLFSQYDIQLLSFDRRISYDGNPTAFMSVYFCYKFLENDLIFEKLTNNNSGRFYIPSKMYEKKVS